MTPANLAVKAKKVFTDLVAKRGELIPALEGAPPRTDTDAFKAYLRRKRIHAYAVNIKVSSFERSLAPNEKQGKSGQVLTVAMELSLIGTSIRSRAGRRSRPRPASGCSRAKRKPRWTMRCRRR